MQKPIASVEYSFFPPKIDTLFLSLSLSLSLLGTLPLQTGEEIKEAKEKRERNDGYEGTNIGYRGQTEQRLGR